MGVSGYVFILLLWIISGMLSSFMAGVIDNMDNSYDKKDMAFTHFIMGPVLLIILGVILLHKALYEAGRDK